MTKSKKLTQYWNWNTTFRGAKGAVWAFHEISTWVFIMSDSTTLQRASQRLRAIHSIGAKYERSNNAVILEKWGGKTQRGLYAAVKKKLTSRSWAPEWTWPVKRNGEKIKSTEIKRHAWPCWSNRLLILLNMWECHQIIRVWEKTLEFDKMFMELVGNNSMGNKQRIGGHVIRLFKLGSNTSPIITFKRKVCSRRARGKQN